MSDPKQTGVQSAAKTSSWASVKPVFVAHEDALDPEKVRVIWSAMMKRAGLNQPSEQAQRAFRLAVYTYCCLNGSSRVGNYSGNIKTSDGFEFQASVIPYATGSLNVRRFLRGCDESYGALKESRVIEEDTRMVSKAAKLGITADCAFAMADWLTDCPDFTPMEKAASDKATQSALSRSRRARDGKTLEAVEQGVRDKGLEVQGRLNSDDGADSFSF